MASEQTDSKTVRNRIKVPVSLMCVLAFFLKQHSMRILEHAMSWLRFMMQPLTYRSWYDGVCVCFVVCWPAFCSLKNKVQKWGFSVFQRQPWQAWWGPNGAGHVHPGRVCGGSCPLWCLTPTFPLCPFLRQRCRWPAWGSPAHMLFSLH